MSATDEKDKWRIWDDQKKYGEVFFRRAKGELPEMESSKKMAREIKPYVIEGDRILDVGCGSGHYLRSLKREIPVNFFYTGVDQTQYYIELGREAYQGDHSCEFMKGDIFGLDFPDDAFDIVMCNNVLLHLPSIRKPLSELIRVARKMVFVRFLCGDKSFIIKDIQPEGEEFDDNGEPLSFHYHNIYSRNHLASLLEKNTKVKKWQIEEDHDFNAENITASVKEHEGYSSATKIMGGYQVNGYILQPWSVLTVELNKC